MRILFVLWILVIGYNSRLRSSCFCSHIWYYQNVIFTWNRGITEVHINMRTTTWQTSYIIYFVLCDSPTIIFKSTQYMMHNRLHIIYFLLPVSCTRKIIVATKGEPYFLLWDCQWFSTRLQGCWYEDWIFGGLKKIEYNYLHDQHMIGNFFVNVTSNGVLHYHHHYPCHHHHVVVTYCKM